MTRLRSGLRGPVAKAKTQGIGDALREAYPEDHEADLAMQRAIAKLNQLEDSPSLVRIANIYDRA